MRAIRYSVLAVLIAGLWLGATGCTNLADDLTFECEGEGQGNCADGFRCVQLAGEATKQCVEWPPGADVNIVDAGDDTGEDVVDDATDTTDTTDDAVSDADADDGGGDADGDGGDVEDCTPTSGETDEEEACDQNDDDCDGVVDEGCACTFGTGDGVCETESTVSAETGECSPPTGYEDDETTCGDTLDNDCDGAVDEGCPCDFMGLTQGVCAASEKDDEGNCIEPDDYDADEAVCDGADNDCDGTIDEGCPCDYAGFADGVCANQTRTDNGDCPIPSSFEANESRCDDADNDCDGTVDEGCECDYTGVSTGVCAFGTVDDNGDCTAPTNYEAPETNASCDGFDNDCDGLDDEECSCADGATRPCYPGNPSDVRSTSTKCEDGSQTCVQGSYDTCSGFVLPDSSETCGDNLDSDCDGALDNTCPCDFNGTDVGVCSNGTFDSTDTCTAPANYESPETSCDGNDNNCDGIVDEGCTCALNGSTTGVCGTATIDSQTGSCVSPDFEANGESSCADGLDNDCNSATDCQDTLCSGAVCSVAGASGSARCQSGACVEHNCSDGNDNDGDGLPDCQDPDCTGATCSSSGGATCSSSGACRETSCGDGVDNDNDGFIDCADGRDCRVGISGCPHRAFLTPAKYRGDFVDSLRKSPDTICADVAAAEGIAHDGTNWRAIVPIKPANKVLSAETRINLIGAVNNMLDQRVAQPSEFFDRNFVWNEPIIYRPDGTKPPCPSQPCIAPVWTGTEADGKAAQNYCADASGDPWHQGTVAALGQAGNAFRVDSDRLAAGSATCMNEAHLYCIEVR